MGTADVDRTTLPIAEPTHPAITELDARKVKAPPIFEVKAPAGAPNVLVILLDNFGYAGSTTFGGVMHLPTIERLAKNGLTYTNFPRRADLLGEPRRTAHRPQSS